MCAWGSVRSTRPWRVEEGGNRAFLRAQERVQGLTKISWCTYTAYMCGKMVVLMRRNSSSTCLATVQSSTAKYSAVCDTPWYAYLSPGVHIKTLALLLPSLFLDCSMLLCTKSWNSASSILPFPSPCRDMIKSTCADMPSDQRGDIIACSLAVVVKKYLQEQASPPGCCGVCRTFKRNCLILYSI